MTECDIYSVSGRKFHTERAIWDTGADTTIISSRIVKELNLQPYKAGGISGIGGATGSNVYLVHVLVPTGDFVTQVEVMESNFQEKKRRDKNFRISNFGGGKLQNSQNHFQNLQNFRLSAKKMAASWEFFFNFAG